LIGGDNWALFPRWYRADEIVRNYQIVVYPRRDCYIDSAQLPANVTIAETELLDISSTEVRQRVKKGQDISRLVPTAILPLVSEYYR
jgi:nicotinate-nucleotide adenylyltransferase